MFESSEIALSKSALEANLAFLHNHIGQATLSSVVKGNAYGHGLAAFAKLAHACGVRHFSVFSASEAYELKACNLPETTILIMGDVDDGALAWAIKEGVEFFVFDMQRLKQALVFSEKCQQKAKIHLEVETGMNRTGISKTELPKAIQFLNQQAAHIDFVGLCTHLAGAESIANYLRIQNQLKRFKLIEKQFAKVGLKAKFTHAACSAGTVAYPSTAFNLVRIGIMQYGLWPSPETKVKYLTQHKLFESPLHRVITWKSKVMALKNVSAGEFVGYGNAFLAQTDMLLAIVPVGYSSGYNRSLSNQGQVLVAGQIARVVGTINMNMLMLDVTRTANLNKGDEVVLIGEQGGQEISVASFSDFSDSLNYELLSRLPESIPRKIID